MTQMSFLPEPTTREEIAAKARQKRGQHEPLDFGLFGTDHLQTDLIDHIDRSTPCPTTTSTTATHVRTVTSLLAAG